MNTTADPPTIAPPEPTGMSLGDLVALIAGAALAASLTWYSQRPRARILAGRPAPDWYIVLISAREILSKGCIALTPLILTRKVRFRGPIRPGEFAALCIAADQLMLALYGWPPLGIVRPMPGRTDVNELDETRWFLWRVATFALPVVAAVVLVAFRRRLPAAVAGLLLVAAWYGLFDPLQSFAHDAVRAVLAAVHVRLSRSGSAIVVEATWDVFRVVGLIPPVFALLDAARRRPGRTWVEWTALALAVGWWLCVNLQTLLRQRFGDLGSRNPAIDAVYVASPVATLVVTVILARILDRPIRRGLGVDTGRPLVPEGPSAKMEPSAPG
jgi:hypothetical protein